MNSKDLKLTLKQLECKDTWLNTARIILFTVSIILAVFGLIIYKLLGLVDVFYINCIVVSILLGIALILSKFNMVIRTEMKDLINKISKSKNLN